MGIYSRFFQNLEFTVEKGFNYNTNMRLYNDKFKLVYLRFYIYDFIKVFYSSIVLRKLIQLIRVHPWLIIVPFLMQFGISIKSHDFLNQFLTERLFFSIFY